MTPTDINSKINILVHDAEMAYWNSTSAKHDGDTVGHLKLCKKCASCLGRAMKMYLKYPKSIWPKESIWKAPLPRKTNET